MCTPFYKCFKFHSTHQFTTLSFFHVSWKSWVKFVLDFLTDFCLIRVIDFKTLKWNASLSSCKSIYYRKTKFGLYMIQNIFLQCLLLLFLFFMTCRVFNIFPRECITHTLFYDQLKNFKNFVNFNAFGQMQARSYLL